MRQWWLRATRLAAALPPAPPAHVPQALLPLLP
jgi:hypothetical protein